MNQPTVQKASEESEEIQVFEFLERSGDKVLFVLPDDRSVWEIDAKDIDGMDKDYWDGQRLKLMKVQHPPL